MRRGSIALEAAMSQVSQEADRLEAEIRTAYERVRLARRQGTKGSEIDALVKDFEMKQRVWMDYIQKHPSGRNSS